MDFTRVLNNTFFKQIKKNNLREASPTQLKFQDLGDSKENTECRCEKESGVALSPHTDLMTIIVVILRVTHKNPLR